MKKNTLVFIILLCSLFWSQDSECSVNVEKYLIYPEESLPKRFWPYQNLYIDAVNRRFYALLHETIYEQTKAGIPDIKICLNDCIRIVEKDKLFGLKVLIINVPEINETSWIFQDNSKLATLIFAPYYAEKIIPKTIEERRRLFMGTVLGVYYIKDMIDQIISPYLVKGIFLTVFEENQINKIYGELLIKLSQNIAPK